MNKNYLNILPRYFSIKKAYKINNHLRLKHIIPEIQIELKYNDIYNVFFGDKLNKTYYFINKRFRPKINRANMPKTHFYYKNFYEKGNKILSLNLLEEEIIKFAKKNKYFVFEKSVLKYNSEIFKKSLKECKIKLQKYSKNNKEKIKNVIDEFDDNNYYDLFIEAFIFSPQFINFKSAFISKFPDINLYISGYNIESINTTYKEDLLRFKYKIYEERKYGEENEQNFLDLHLNFFPFEIQYEIKNENLMKNIYKYLLKLYTVFFGYPLENLDECGNLLKMYIHNKSKCFKKIDKTPIFKINE